MTNDEVAEVKTETSRRVGQCVISHMIECLLNLNHHLPFWEKPQKGLITTVIPLSPALCASQTLERATMPSQKELSVLIIPLQLSLVQSSATTRRTHSAGPGPPKLGPKRAKPFQSPPSPSPARRMIIKPYIGPCPYSIPLKPTSTPRR